MDKIALYETKHGINWKHIIFVICAVALIVCSGFLGKVLAEYQYQKYIEKEARKESKTLDIGEIIVKETSTVEPTPTPKPVIQIQHRVPIYTEEGKDKMTNVYTSDYKRVFLTFDDGPSSNITPLILDVLKTNNIKATFFTLGSRVEANPQIVKRAYDEGHYIANHGYSHNYGSIYASMNNLLAEYNKTEGIIRNAIGVPEYSSHLFRFPGGSVGGKYNSVKTQYKKTLAEQEIFYLDWNCLNEDASGVRTKEQLVGFIKQYSENHNSLVVLMHDAEDKILTYETLQEVIDYYKENGYVFENFYDIINYDIVIEEIEADA